MPGTGSVWLSGTGVTRIVKALELVGAAMVLNGPGTVAGGMVDISVMYGSGRGKSIGIGSGGNVKVLSCSWGLSRQDSQTRNLRFCNRGPDRKSVV